MEQTVLVSSQSEHKLWKLFQPDSQIVGFIFPGSVRQFEQGIRIKEASRCFGRNVTDWSPRLVENKRNTIVSKTRCETFSGFAAGIKQHMTSRIRLL
jgi:hypothetical protein